VTSFQINAPQVKGPVSDRPWFLDGVIPFHLAIKGFKRTSKSNIMEA
jgi:hypothetical protein